MGKGQRLALTMNTRWIHQPRTTTLNVMVQQTSDRRLNEFDDHIYSSSPLVGTGQYQFCGWPSRKLPVTRTRSRCDAELRFAPKLTSSVGQCRGEIRTLEGSTSAIATQLCCRRTLTGSAWTAAPASPLPPTPESNLSLHRADKCLTRLPQCLGKFEDRRQ